MTTERLIKGVLWCVGAARPSKRTFALVSPLGLPRLQPDPDWMVMEYSLVIPVYKNEASIPRLLETLSNMAAALDNQMEAVFVVDGSPDNCTALLRESLGTLSFPAQLVLHSRNFGSFAAIRTGLAAARGKYFAVMAADLQEPPELAEKFFHELEADTCDVVIGTRTSRQDALASQLASHCFWACYRRLIVPDMPVGGVDMFGCNQLFRENLLQLAESRTSLIALLFWLGFRRQVIGYSRLERLEGVSAWTLGKKIDYMLDSIFAFTDLPIRLLLKVGGSGILISLLFGLCVLIAKLTGFIPVPGYTTTMLLVLFLGSLNLFSLGIVGSYAWRGYENSKRRPLAVIFSKHNNNDSFSEHP